MQLAPGLPTSHFFFLVLPDFFFFYQHRSSLASSLLHIFITARSRISLIGLLSSIYHSNAARSRISHLSVIVHMASFTPVNGNGAYFADQIEMDVFAVLGLHADDMQLSMRGVRSHFRTRVMPHVFLRGEGVMPASSGPRVPTWAQVNEAKGILLDKGAANFNKVRTAWSRRSFQVWNPFAAVGSEEVQLPREDRTGMF